MEQNNKDKGNIYNAENIMNQRALQNEMAEAQQITESSINDRFGKMIKEEIDAILSK